MLYCWMLILNSVKVSHNEISISARSPSEPKAQTSDSDAPAVSTETTPSSQSEEHWFTWRGREPDGMDWGVNVYHPSSAIYPHLGCVATVWTVIPRPLLSCWAPFTINVMNRVMKKGNPGRTHLLPGIGLTARTGAPSRPPQNTLIRWLVCQLNLRRFSLGCSKSWC